MIKPLTWQHLKSVLSPRLSPIRRQQLRTQCGSELPSHDDPAKPLSASHSLVFLLASRLADCSLTLKHDQQTALLDSYWEPIQKLGQLLDDVLHGPTVKGNLPLAQLVLIDEGLYARLTTNNSAVVDAMKVSVLDLRTGLAVQDGLRETPIELTIIDLVALYVRNCRKAEQMAQRNNKSTTSS